MLLFFSFSLLFSKNKLKLNYPSTAHHHLVVTVSHRIITLCKLRNKKVNFLFVEVVPFFFFCSRRAKRRWQRRRSLLLFNRPGLGSESFQVLTEDVIMFCFVFFKVYWKAISNKCVMLLNSSYFRIIELNADRKKEKSQPACFCWCLICFSDDTHRLGRVGSPAGRAVAQPAGTSALFLLFLLHHLLFLVLLGSQAERREPEEEPEGFQLHQGSRQRQLRQGGRARRRRARGMFICLFLIMFIIKLFLFLNQQPVHGVPIIHNTWIIRGSE